MWIFALLLLLPISEALADTRLGIAFDTPERLRGTLNYTGSVHSSADIPDQARTLDSHDHVLNLRIPMSRTRQSVWAPKLTAGYRGQESGAVIGTIPVPKGLAEVTLGADYIRNTERNNFLGLSASAGFKSDQIGKSLHELGFEALVFLRSPSTQTSGWIYFGQFSNNRNYLNWLPIPGIAYHSAWRDKLSFALGVPYSSFRLAPSREFRFEGSFQLFQAARAQAIYSVESGEAFVLGFRWDHEGYLLNGRTDRSERLIVEEKRVFGGFEAQIIPDFRLQLVAGMLFDKKLARRTSMFKDPASQIVLDPALFGTLNVYVTF